MNLRGHSITMGLSKAELELLGAKLTEHCFAAGETLLLEGAASRGLMLVNEGTLSISKRDEKNISKELTVLAAPTALGELEILSNDPCTATVSATAPVKALVLSLEDFENLVNEGGPLVAKLTRNIARIAIKRLTSTNKRFVEMINWQA